MKDNINYNSIGRTDNIKHNNLDKNRFDSVKKGVDTYQSYLIDSLPNTYFTDEHKTPIDASKM